MYEYRVEKWLERTNNFSEKVEKYLEDGWKMGDHSVLTINSQVFHYQVLYRKRSVFFALLKKALGK